MQVVESLEVKKTSGTGTACWEQELLRPGCYGIEYLEGQAVAGGNWVVPMFERDQEEIKTKINFNPNPNEAIGSSLTTGRKEELGSKRLYWLEVEK